MTIRRHQGLLVGSANARFGFADGIQILGDGGSALDAVVATVRAVETNADDHSVGYGGLPNILGDVELDASIVDGRGLRAGAVGALRNYHQAIDTARGVMEQLPHAFLAGEGAARFAAELGFEAVTLLTPESEAKWRNRLPDGIGGESPESSAHYIDHVRELVRRVSRDPELADPEPPHGTVNVLARDAKGNIASAVSTSGWAWKYPGRLGDSPVIGAGNYCDNRYGAAACTGRGEMALRCCTAHTVIMLMRFGTALSDAVEIALRDLEHLDDPYASEVNIVGLDAAGNHAGASTASGKTYLWQTSEMAEPDEPPRQHVPIEVIARANLPLPTS